MDKKDNSIYSTFNKGLYRITGSETTDEIMDMMYADSGKNLSGSVTVPAEILGSGIDTSTTPTATGSTQAGKKTFDNTTAGYILGVDPTDGKAKFYIGSTTKYINWDGTTLTVVGGVNVSQIDIPDQVTANSFHVDNLGNSWWGSNVATGYAGANAYVLASGSAVFKDIQVGGTTVQYVITNSGIFSFGDGSDGDATIAADTTLSSDKYYNNLTINAGKTLSPAGYRVFVKGTFTINGKASGDGAAGNSGASGGGQASGGDPTAIPAGGASVSNADGYLKGSPATGAGGNGAATNTGTATVGSDGTAVLNALGSASVAAGAGGAAVNSGAAAGATATATASNVKLIANWHLATLLDVSSTGSTVKFTNSASGPGGGGGGKGSSSGCTAPSGAAGGAAGSGGTSGRILAIYARVVVIGASGSITSNGGQGGGGGNGGNAYQTNNTCGATRGGGGGGGGSGGNGGIVILVYNSLTNSGSITANGGAGGAGGSGGTGWTTGPETSGTNGTTGAAGVIYQFQLSL